MKITLNKAIELLEESSAVIWGDNFLCYAGIRDESEENPDVFLVLENEVEGELYKVEFSKKDNQTVSVQGSSMFLINTDKEKEQISVLGPMTLDNPIW